MEQTSKSTSGWGAFLGAVAIVMLALAGTAPVAGAATASRPAVSATVPALAHGHVLVATGGDFPAPAVRRPSVVVPGVWNDVPVPDPGPTAGGNAYLGDSCAGPSFCVAVGVSDLFGPTADQLAARWDGSTWSAMRGLAPGSQADGKVYLYGVSCTSPSFCIGRRELRQL